MNTEAVRQAQERLKAIPNDFVQLQFVDLQGGIRAVTFPKRAFLEDKIWEDGTNFDSSSVGVGATKWSDMILIPEPDTLQDIHIGDMNITRVLGRIHTADMQPFRGDPRTIAAKVMEEAAGMGYDRVTILPEMEFFLFSSMEQAITENDVWTRDWEHGTGNLTSFPEYFDELSTNDYLKYPKYQYFSSVPFDDTFEYRNRLSSILEGLGYPVKYHHHEGGSRQNELEFQPFDSLVTAGDGITLHKLISRVLGQQMGYIPTYMPKPIYSDAGNGMHFHIRLFRDGEPVFHDGNNEFALSQEAYHFIGGILKYAPEFTALTNPTVNSYKRLVPEMEAPVYLTWSPLNRTALVRIPARRKDPSSVDIEVRNPDPTANPYLAMAAVVHFGLRGIKEQIEPPKPFQQDPNKLSRADIKKLNIAMLPGSLREALAHLEGSKDMRELLGDEIFERFITMKQEEMMNYRRHISTWEFFKYFHV
jgi:glutamine synthetase